MKRSLATRTTIDFPRSYILYTAFAGNAYTNYVVKGPTAKRWKKIKVSWDVSAMDKQDLYGIWWNTRIIVFRGDDIVLVCKDR